MANLIISLDAGEHARRLPKDERFQVEGEEQLRRHLDDSLDRARKLGDRGQGDFGMVSERVHDAIFIDGARGSGKTNFMLNMATAAEELKDVHFCTPIDPTLLDGTESFLNVVIAKLHVEVKDRQKERDQGYYRAFEAVAQALESQEETAEAGMSRILSHRHSLGLIAALDDYYRAACAVLGCALAVIPIDDIDMAFDKAYEILDVIRRYLASPLVVPVVSGDLDLYAHILRTRFHHDLNRDIPHGHTFNHKELADKYLEKVLPVQRRIRLKNVPELLAAHTATVHTADKKADLRRVMEFLKHAVFRQTNGQEDSHPPLLPESARSLMQLLWRLGPTIRAVDWTAVEDENSAQTAALKVYERGDVYRTLLTDLAAHWQDSLRLLVEAELALGTTAPPQRPLVELPLFSVDKQSLLPGAAIPWEYWDGSVERRRTVLPMPVLEPIDTDAIFAKDDLAKRNGSAVGLSAKILSHDNYYSSHQTSNLVFLGRLFEIIVNSFFTAPTVQQMQKLLAEAPLHSHFSLLSTKSIDLNMETQNENFDDSEKATAPLETFVAQINAWRQEKVKSRPSAQLLYKAMNKAFTQFDLLHQERRLNRNSIEQVMERAFRIITNAFASFEKNTLVAGQEIIARQNTGLGETIDPNTTDKDNCYRINVLPAARQPGSVTGAVHDHPVFTLIDRTGESGLYVGSTASRSAESPWTSARRPATDISVANTYLKERAGFIELANNSDSPPADVKMAILKTIQELRQKVPDLDVQINKWSKQPNYYNALLTAARKLGVEHDLPRRKR